MEADLAVERIEVVSMCVEPFADTRIQGIRHARR